MKKRFLFYNQHLSGTGHFIRTLEIARTLAANQEVYMIDGGRIVPRPESKAHVKFIELPRIVRKNDALAGIENNDSITTIMDKRKKLLQQSIDDIEPDIIIIEHFPFSKWVLHDEIIFMIKHIKKQNIHAKVICSVRDIVNNTCDEPKTNKELLITTTLQKHFDYLMVHSDIDFIKLDDHIPWIKKVNVPIHYTGYVSEKITHNNSIIEKNEKSKNIIISMGGNGSHKTIQHCINAWQSSDMKEIASIYKLIIFLPINFDQHNIDIISDSIQILPFSTSFLSMLHNAALSISEAGYNTCMNILETKTSALLIPNSTMSDQLPRAKIFHKHGFVSMLNPDNMNTSNLVDKIKLALHKKTPTHNINLNGAVATASFLTHC